MRSMRRPTEGYKKQMARPTKLTPEIQNRICDNIRLGMSYERAAVCAGVCEATLYIWKAKGREAKGGRYLEFLEALRRAEMEGERQLLANIQQAADDGKWPAASWILERRHPSHWAKVTKHEIRDWRKEAQEQGLDPAVIFEQYLEGAATAIAGSNGEPEGGGVGGGISAVQEDE